jgi:hypothetical protein
MLRSLGRFTTRYFLVAIIFIYFIISSILSFCEISSGWLTDMNEFVNCLLGILIFVVFTSPPLLSLFLLRRPSFARVLLHVATAFYMLLIIYIVYLFTLLTSDDLLWKYVAFTFLLVYSGGALVAGLPEATAAGMWARLVYYVVLLLWIYFVLYVMNLAESQIAYV